MTYLRPIPHDFATVAAAMSAGVAAEHYAAAKDTARRWIKSMPAEWQAARAINVRAPIGSRERPMPADFDEIAQVRSFPEIAEHYTCSVDTLRRWVRAQSKEWAAERAKLMRTRQLGGVTPKPRKAYGRQSKPAAATFIGCTPTADASLAGRAAEHLKRVTRILPIFDAGKVYGRAMEGFYVVGRQTLPAVEMIGLAKVKGFDPDEWKRLAA